MYKNPKYLTKYQIHLGRCFSTAENFLPLTVYGLVLILLCFTFFLISHEVKNMRSKKILECIVLYFKNVQLIQFRPQFVCTLKKKWAVLRKKFLPRNATSCHLL